MEDDEGVTVACLDDNGLLTNLSSDIKDEDGTKTINFVTGHCSTYVIYSRSSRTPSGNGEEVLSYEEENAAGNASLSGTWQTLNKKVYGPVSTKWFIIIILVAMAGILVLYDRGRKKHK